MSKHRYLREMRLHRQSDFNRIHEANTFAADAVLVVRALRNDLGTTRIGISLSRKVGNAVLRNHWKRLIREAFRLRREELPVGLDMVVRPRRGAVPEFHAISRSLLQLARRLDRTLRNTPTKNS